MHRASPPVSRDRFLAATLPVVLLLAGCSAPMGADRVGTRRTYAQVEANAMRSGRPGANTLAVLRRFDWVSQADARPDEVVPLLHAQALSTGERNLLFALAELSHAAGNRIRRSVKPWDPRDARDFYLASALYAWLYLFGEGKDPLPGPFDRRFREACDFYNYGLGLALTQDKSTQGPVRLEGGRRALPAGGIELRLDADAEAMAGEHGEALLLADQFRVRGLSVRNRSAGLGTPLIRVLPPHPQLGIRRAMPATLLLRGPTTLAALDAGGTVCELEWHSPFDSDSVMVGQARVPLEADLTIPMAYTLNQATVWKLGPLQFLAPPERFGGQLILSQPYDPRRIPVVFVHGTFSSPVTWAEMGNALTADPVLRQRYQFWSYMYGSGNPLIYSMADFRDALEAQVRLLDPDGTNPTLRQMVLVGHSQGGLLTKSAAIDTGDRIWRLFSTNRLEEVQADDARRAEMRRLFFLEPLPFVKRVVFVATPHRGSYLSVGIARRWAQRAVSLPGAILAGGAELLRFASGSELQDFLNGDLPTSLDGMSPRNPALLEMAEIPPAPGILAHSIIPVRGEGDLQEGRDGVVAYSSAHVDYAVSERVVPGNHFCLEKPATIQEVRRILREHLDALPPP